MSAARAVADGPAGAIVAPTTLQRCGQKESVMFDHIGIGVGDIAASKAFFLEALAPLGIGVVMEFPETVGIGPPGKAALWLAAGPSAPTHLAFTAANRPQVDEFYRRALAAGGKDNGAPGIRAHYHPNYYGAFVIGPDGHNIEAVCHVPPA
jgi:catechol 2,3-dioxygenase-like lactoylglutathione lyase family enzyme